MFAWLKGNSGDNGAPLKGRLFYGWIVIAACFLIATMINGTSYSFGVFFKPLEEDFGLTRAMTSGVYSLHMILCCAVAILGGWALDRYGPRIVVALTGFFIGLSLLLTSQAGEVWHLYISYSLLLALGIGATSYTILMATASRWFIKKRGIALGIVGSGIGLGTVIAAPTATYLISAYGWRTSYFIIAFAASIVIMLLALPLRKDPAEIGSLPDGETSNVVEIATRGQQNDAEARE